MISRSYTLSNANLCAAWVSWKWFTARQHHRCRTVFILQRRRSRALLWASLRALQWHALRQQHCRNIIKRALRARTRRALRAWRCEATSRVTVRARLALLCARRQVRGKTRVLHAWRSVALRLSSNARCIQLCLSRSALRMLTLCWRHWRWLSHSMALLKRVFSRAHDAWLHSFEVSTIESMTDVQTFVSYDRSSLIRLAENLIRNCCTLIPKL